MNHEELQDLRLKLNDLDKDICSMLHFRMVISEEIFRIKKKNEIPFEDLQREDEILDAVKEQTQNPVLKEKVKQIFQILMDSSKINGYLRTVHDLPYRKVGIAGWGLIGGSLAKWTKAKDKLVRLYALDNSSIDLELAKNEGYVEELCFNTHDFVDEIDFMIIALPLSEIIPFAKSASEAAKKRSKKLVVMDVGSVKKEITEAFERLTHPLIEFVSTHPMAGSEKLGFASSDATLFYKAPWILIPHSKNQPETLQIIQDVISFYGANPMVMDAETHDKKTALISHLPGDIASKYIRFVEENDAESSMLSGPGYRSFTRIGNSNPRLRKDIADFNKEWLQYYKERWNKFEKGSK